MSRFLQIAPVVFVACAVTACSSAPSTVPNSGNFSQSVSGNATTSTQCPADPRGTGILPDGDFSQATEPPNGLETFSAPNSFAPDWTVYRNTIDLYSSTIWNAGGYCSVDLDGSQAGGISSSPFPTKKGKLYYVTFLLSGNGGSGPMLKKFRIAAGKQSLIMGWEANNGNDAQNGKYSSEIWRFTASSTTTILNFISLDPVYCKSGAVVTDISVSTSPRKQ